ncbi:MAG: hypothetical protein ACRD0Q_10390, partial [Acidimicrobiales bacterium]
TYGSANNVGLPGPGMDRTSRVGLELSLDARADLASGQVDARVVSALGIQAERFAIEVSVIRSGHSQCVGGGSFDTQPGCSVSEHWNWRAVDITAVGGQPVTPSNGSAAALAQFLMSMPAPIRPDELGVPWAALSAVRGVFSDADHQTHIHLGWRQSAPARSG